LAGIPWFVDRVVQPGLETIGKTWDPVRTKLRTNSEREKCPRLSSRISSFREKLSQAFFDCQIRLDCGQQLGDDGNGQHSMMTVKDPQP
jgi:hypothetical protein